MPANPGVEAEYATLAEGIPGHSREFPSGFLFFGTVLLSENLPISIQGRAKGALEASRAAILEVLEERFEMVPKRVSTAIQVIDNLSVLKLLHKKSVTVASLSHFQEILQHCMEE